jgi:hypothetical protein
VIWLNKFMQEDHPTQHIYEELKRLCVVENQSEFSRLCGRTPMWFSCIKARQLPLTSDAALTLAYRLRRIAANSLSENTYDQLMRLSEVLLENANSKVAEKVSQHEIF